MAHGDFSEQHAASHAPMTQIWSGSGPVGNILLDDPNAIGIGKIANQSVRRILVTNAALPAWDTSTGRTAPFRS